MFLGHGLLSKLAQAVLIVAGLCCLYVFAVLPLTWWEQAVVGVGMLALAFWLGRWSRSQAVSLMLMVLSVFATVRYGWWRLTTVADYFREPVAHRGWASTFFVVALLVAESYAVGILFVGYLQRMWPGRREKAAPLDEAAEWPDVDLLIPTFDEPLSAVRHILLAAMNIDWPVDKIRIYLLDDGKREEFRRFAYEAGVGYVTRSDNKGAKAGNINHALSRLHAPFVVIFDADHLPARNFLRVTMGCFLHDPKLGMLQTPRHFYSPDPLERNRALQREIEGEGEMLRDVAQDGDDLWNVALFCGSCAVLRRSALDEIGGIATETVTEDAHTALRLQRNGWNTTFINLPQAEGQATENLSGHVKQRIRWARGMAQIMRLENPLFAQGLGVHQRLSYAKAMAHFFYAVPRLMFLTAPLIFLLLSRVSIPGYWAALAAYALPHLALWKVAHSRVMGRDRHSFWNEIYETILAPHLLVHATRAFLDPTRGRPQRRREMFQTRIARPFLLLLLLNFAGLVAAIGRFVWWDRGTPGTVLVNVAWALFNVVILGTAVAVCGETQQRRSNLRFESTLLAAVVAQDGTSFAGGAMDISAGGAAIRFSGEAGIDTGDVVHLHFYTAEGPVDLPARLVGNKGNTLRFQFSPLTIFEQEQLDKVMNPQAGTWLGLGEGRGSDRPWRSLWRILCVAVSGLGQAASMMAGGGGTRVSSGDEQRADVAGTQAVP